LTNSIDNPAVIARIRQLNTELELAREAYYKSATPIMSDAEYDKKEKNLRDIVKSSPWLAEFAPVLTTVGNDLMPAAGRIRHSRPMLSIENKYEKSEIDDFQKNVLHGEAMLLEPKRDGISCELRYREGKLQLALTRGSGSEGEDITAQIRVLRDIPKEIKYSDAFPHSLDVRGELVMRKSELERLNKIAREKGGKEYQSTRNLVAGTVKLKDMNEVAKREILFIPWEMTGDGQLSDSGYVRMTMLASAGFAKYEGYLVDPADSTDVIKVLDHILKENEQSQIVADGVVAKADSMKLRKELGGGTKFANYQVCYKPQTDFATTYLRKIVWQTGRSGKLTPVGECDPVPLAGAVVTRATLNNLSFIEEMGLKLNAKVKMLRSGGVIPEIDGVIEEGDTAIKAPGHCPECGSIIVAETDERSGILTHWCQNVECPGRVSDLFYFIGGRGVLEIDGLGPEMALKIVKDGYARNIGELFEFQTEAMEGIKTHGEENFDRRMAKRGFSVVFRKMVQSMELAKKKDWDRWIMALGIPMIGGSLSKVLATKLELMPESMKYLTARLLDVEGMEIEGIGFHKKQMILDWAKDSQNRKICEALYNAGVAPKAPEKVQVVAGEPLKNVVFVITGEFSEDREKITAKLVKLGATSKSGVSSKVNLLIVGEAPGKTKTTKAKELGIQQVGKDWLVNVLRENGMELSGSGLDFEMDEA